MEKGSFGWSRGSKTYEQIKHATTVSIRTINIMAKVLHEVPEVFKEKLLAARTAGTSTAFRSPI